MRYSKWSLSKVDRMIRSALANSAKHTFGRAPARLYERRLGGFLTPRMILLGGPQGPALKSRCARRGGWPGGSPRAGTVRFRASGPTTAAGLKSASRRTRVAAPLRPGSAWSSCRMCWGCSIARSGSTLVLACPARWLCDNRGGVALRRRRTDTLLRCTGPTLHRPNRLSP